MNIGSTLHFSTEIRVFVFNVKPAVLRFCASEANLLKRSGKKSRPSRDSSPRKGERDGVSWR